MSNETFGATFETEKLPPNDEIFYINGSKENLWQNYHCLFLRLPGNTRWLYCRTVLEAT